MKGLKKNKRNGKRTGAVLLVLILLLTSVTFPTTRDIRKVYAAAEGIANGDTYRIVSAYNGKAITHTDLYTFYANCVVWNTKTTSNLQRWKVEESGDYYTFTNSYSGKGIKIKGNSNGSELDLNGNDGSNNYKWKLIPITSGDYAGCFYIASAVQNDDGEDELAEIISDEDKRDKDGAQVRLWTKAKSVEYEPRQIWRFEKSDPDENKFKEAMHDEMVSAFRDYYFKKNDSTGYNRLLGGFWGRAEVLEAMLDGYETTGKRTYREMFEGTYNDFIAEKGDYWTDNDFNDDIAWAVLASVRAYLLFGDSNYLDIAKKNFDFMYNRAIRSDGMLRWSHESGRGDGSLSCINGPGTVAACYLAIATGDDSYYTKGKGVFDAWRNSDMYIADGDDAGHVKDSSGNGWVSTYNQGTFIGAATMLYEKYGDQQYFEDAHNAVKAVYRYICNGNVLKEERTNSGDLSGMRGILMRYMRKFIVDFDMEEYLPFFHENALVAYMNRNSTGIVQCAWNEKTPEETSWDAFAAYNAISCIANIPTYSEHLERDAYSTIEAEDMDYTKGLISEGGSGTSGGRSLGGVKNGHYTAYYNVDFGQTGAATLTLKYSRETQQEGENGTIEFRLGSTTGPSIAKVSVENTGTWQNWREITVDTARVTGVQNIYVVYKANTSNVINFDYFKFGEATDSNQGYMFLKSESVERYARAEDGASNTTVLALSNVREDWEGYRVEKNEDGTVCLRSLVSGKYVHAAQGGDGYYITADSNTINDSSKFVIERFAASDSVSKQVAIKSVQTGKYLMVDPSDNKSALLANSERIGGSWETFHFETVEGEWIVPDGAVLTDSAYLDAGSDINAVDYSATGGSDATEPGVKKDKDSNNNPTNVGGVENEDWVQYDYVRFGEKTPETFELYFSAKAGDARGFVEVYIDSMESTPVAKIDLFETGNDWSNYVTIEGDINGTIPAGAHTVYLKFTTQDNRRHVCNFKSFSFNETSGIRDAFDTIEAEQVADHEITKIYGAEGDYVNGYLGETNVDSWARYDSIRFDTNAKSISLRYSAKCANSKGTIYVYVDGMHTDSVAQIRTTGTGEGWADYVEEQILLTSEIQAGTHSVYLKFAPDNSDDDNIIHVANVDRFVFSNSSVLVNDDVRIVGYQISSVLGGDRVVASVEPTIQGRAVKEWGLVYGLKNVDGEDMGVSDKDMITDSDNPYVASYKSTEEGTLKAVMGDSQTAIYYVRTMLFPAFTSKLFEATYKVRAYAVLEGDIYVYSDICEYSDFEIAKYLYENERMNTIEGHDFLYNRILHVVDPTMKTVDYEWGKAIAKPDEE